MNATIQFTCPLCQKKMNLPATTVGRQGNCPGCKQVVTIQVDPPQLEPQPPTPETQIDFTCPLCGKKMQLPASTVGRQGACPGCKQSVTIQPDISSPVPEQPAQLVPTVVEPPIPHPDSEPVTPMQGAENIPPAAVPTMAGVQGHYEAPQNRDGVSSGLDETGPKQYHFFKLTTAQDELYEIDLEHPVPPFSMESSGDKSHHSITQRSSVFIVTLATIAFFPFFFYFWFMRYHGKLPRLTESDPTSFGQVLLHSVIPYRWFGLLLFPLWPVYLIIWYYHVNVRLCERINVQLVIRGKEPTAPTHFMTLLMKLFVAGFIPIVGFLAGLGWILFPVLIPICAVKLQRSINELAACSAE